MAERAGYDPADAVADATGVRNRRDYSISAIAPRNLAEKVGFAPTSRIFHDWYVSTVLPSARLGDFSIEIGREDPIRTDGRLITVAEVQAQCNRPLCHFSK